MSVLVDGMNMPKSCFDCPISHPAYAMTLICAINGKLIMAPICEKKRMDECPLVEVQTPHGRLIDESAIDLSKYEKAAHDALHNDKGSILYDSGVLAGARAITQLVRHAPTIIPASKEGER